MISHETKRFLDHLPDIVENYNNTEHSSTKRTPIDLIKDKDAMQKINSQLSYSNAVNVGSKTAEFNQGDNVRVKLDKKFDKGNKFSLTSHKVTEVNPYSIKVDNGKQYSINDIIKIPQGNLKISEFNKELEEAKKEKAQKRFLRREGLI
jgi:hypothetical protein